MSRTFRRIGALGASTVALVAFCAAAPVFADDGDGFEFTLYSKEVPAPGNDESAPPPKVGDSFSFADDLYTSKGGEKAGRDGVSCAVVRTTGTSVDVHCVGTFLLTGKPGGQLTAQALTTFDTAAEQQPPEDIPITGGTGDFKNAHGYIRTSTDGDYERLEFHITTR
ncbi:hypothetical protein ACFTWD_22905 [Streptomyces sp. NPDC056943]|uniref:allene oxide cyclase barrel-like domain-containing protein n=1 Tax=Streptomyces sp. NPDC056943 TaxID=3345971 RepID=UPI003631DC2C